MITRINVLILDKHESNKKLIEEIQFTDVIQSLCDFGNRHILGSFKMRLVIESSEENREEITPMKTKVDDFVNYQELGQIWLCNLETVQSGSLRL